MHWRERSIRERFERQMCSQCGAPYPPASVVVIAHRGAVYVLMASCDQCQHRAIFLVSFPEQSASAHPTISRPHATHPEISPLLTSSALHSSSARSTVTTADVDEMRQFLASFDGDFRSLFGR
jgi:hypothetical protein